MSPEKTGQNFQHRFSDSLRANAESLEVKLSDDFIFGCDLARTFEQRLMTFISSVESIKLGRKGSANHPDSPEHINASSEFISAKRQQLIELIEKENGWLENPPDGSVFKEHPDIIEGVEAYRRASALERKREIVQQSASKPDPLGDKVALVHLTLEKIREINSKKLNDWVHDINNKLTSVIGYLSLIQKDLPFESPELNHLSDLVRHFSDLVHHLNYSNLKQFGANLNIILPQLSKLEPFLSRLQLNDLLQSTRENIIGTQDTLRGLNDYIVDFQKDMHGEISKFKALDISKIIQEAAIFSNSFQDSIRFEIQIKSHADLHLHANKSDISRILENLIKNAHEALNQKQEGEKNIILKTSMIDTVEIEIFQNNCFIKEVKKFDPPALMIQCINNGPAIEEAHLHTIFNGHFSTKSSIKDEKRGIGLKTCTGIIQNYGGIIKAENTPEGVCFTIILPFNSDLED